MRQFLIIILFQLILTNGKCQGKFKEDSIIVNIIFPKWNSNSMDSVLLYTDKAFNIFESTLKEQLDNYKFFKWKGDTLIFTQKEKQFIVSQTKRNSNYVWPEGLFKNSKRVTPETYGEAFEKLNREQRELYYGKEFNPKNLKINRLFSFTKPIYIRDNTLAIIYICGLCGSQCGSDAYVVYKKIDNKWTYYVGMFGGEY